MPEGVEHLGLLTDITSVSAVQLSMMPEGVEHKLTAEQRALCVKVHRSKRRPLPFRTRVQLSMMPEGVEHNVELQGCVFTIGVQLSMMPEGVEHNGDPDQLDPLAARAALNDAGRR